MLMPYYIFRWYFTCHWSGRSELVASVQGRWKRSIPSRTHSFGSVSNTVRVRRGINFVQSWRLFFAKQYFRREAMKQSILSDTTNTCTLNNKKQSKKPSASSILLNCGKKSHQRREKHRKSHSKCISLNMDTLRWHYRDYLNNRLVLM